jgi:hypothetical protein
MVTLPRSVLSRDNIFSRVIGELVHDRETASEIAGVVKQFRDANDAEHRRLTEWEIRRMLAMAILRENPRLTREQAEFLLERRLEAAFKPYNGPPAQAKSKSPTGADLARAQRRATVRKGREGRR